MLLNIDPHALESAILDLNDRIAAIAEDVSLDVLRAVHRDMRTLVDLLWIDEVTKFTNRYTSNERAALIRAIAQTETLLRRLPALPEHAS